MVCPLRLIATASVDQSDIDIIPPDPGCVEEECAWWDENGCLVATYLHMATTPMWKILGLPEEGDTE